MEIERQHIENRIISLRNVQVMIDRDIAELYNVDTKALNQAVKRNIERFPEAFRFQLNEKEKNELVTICDRFHSLKHSSTLPYAFTEQGVSMLSAVLRSQTAIKVSIAIINAFIEMRKFISTNAAIFQRLEGLELKQYKNELNFEKVFKALEHPGLVARQGIFFEGQVFDAHTLVADIIRSAKRSIVLIDNYIDDTILKQLTKRNKGVEASIYTKNMSQALQNDIKKHNLQYAPVTIKPLNSSHDRFLIIDRNEVYHFGASLKDLGKKWFAFSKLGMDANDILNKI